MLYRDSTGRIWNMDNVSSMYVSTRRVEFVVVITGSDINAELDLEIFPVCLVALDFMNWLTENWYAETSLSYVDYILTCRMNKILESIEDNHEEE